MLFSQLSSSLHKATPHELQHLILYGREERTQGRGRAREEEGPRRGREARGDEGPGHRRPNDTILLSSCIDFYVSFFPPHSADSKTNKKQRASSKCQLPKRTSCVTFARLFLFSEKRRNSSKRFESLNSCCEDFTLKHIVITLKRFLKNFLSWNE